MKFINGIDFKYYTNIIKKILYKFNCFLQVTYSYLQKIAIYLKFYSVSWYQARLKGYLC